MAIYFTQERKKMWTQSTAVCSAISMQVSSTKANLYISTNKKNIYDFILLMLRGFQYILECNSMFFCLYCLCKIHVIMLRKVIGVSVIKLAFRTVFKPQDSWPTHGP